MERELKKDKEESLRVNERNGYELGMCYKNAFMSVGEIPGAEYVEGYFILNRKNLPQIPIEHGWIKTQDGTIIDPTLPDDDGIYVEAESWTLEEVLPLVEKRPLLPLLSIRDKTYRDATEKMLDIIERSKNDRED